MKKLFFITIVFVFFVSCTTSSPVVVPDEKVTEKKPEIGWIDQNTYTVRVRGENLEEAKSRARHRILKDIINVRVRNGSRYTDITKIKDEFEKPIKNGQVIKESPDAEGIMIYFQIRDRGLRKKFERK